MKNFLHCGVSNIISWLMVATILCVAARCSAQDNIWTSTTSGNWQDASWSLGALPGTNHTVWITNYGWKAVQIGSATARDFPQSLNVDSITVSSPTNSFNTLLVNYAGAGTPLTVKSLTVASNAALAMYSSGLQINGPNGSGAMIGGEFDQNDSVVAGNQINVGYIGSGVYNFNSGYFTVSHLWIGNTPWNGISGVFNQNGGTNGFGITHLDGGKYVLNDGYYGATIYFNNQGEFHQQGGRLVSELTLFGGNYVLAGGVHQGGTTVPTTDGWQQGFGHMLQTGGTNYGSLDIGSYGGGFYTLSNGVSIASNLTVGFKGNYFQADGTQTVAGMINIREDQIAQGYYSVGIFNISGGQLSSSGMSLQGFYTQTGGTNIINGDITMSYVDTSLSISGGLLTVNNLTEHAGWQGGVSMTGGTLIITNSLSVEGIDLPNWHGFSCGGHLVVASILLSPRAIFSCRDGVIDQSGTLAMNNATLYSGTNSVQLGELYLGGDNTGSITNSTLYLVSPTSVVNFADSRTQGWQDGSMLVIEGWRGSLFGGGQQQIVFGKNAGALTSAQLAHIQFHKPAGLAAGTYPARMLATGEIVPASGTPVPASMSLTPQPAGMQVILQGEAGRVYSIETSTDLVHWATWTNQMNSTGTISITDTDSKNYPMRFYRARPMP
jgi:hypothetical protein